MDPRTFSWVRPPFKFTTLLMPAKPNLPCFRHWRLQRVIENGFWSFLLDDYQCLSISLVKLGVDPRTFTWVRQPSNCTHLLRPVKAKFPWFRPWSLQRVIHFTCDYHSLSISLIIFCVDPGAFSWVRQPFFLLSFYGL